MVPPWSRSLMQAALASGRQTTPLSKVGYRPCPQSTPHPLCRPYLSLQDTLGCSYQPCWKKTKIHLIWRRTSWPWCLTLLMILLLHPHFTDEQMETGENRVHNLQEHTEFSTLLSLLDKLYRSCCKTPKCPPYHDACFSLSHWQGFHFVHIFLYCHPGVTILMKMIP